jgi:hypothetical protein
VSYTYQVYERIAYATPLRTPAYKNEGGAGRPLRDDDPNPSVDVDYKKATRHFLKIP